MTRTRPYVVILRGRGHPASATGRYARDYYGASAPPVAIS